MLKVKSRILTVTILVLMVVGVFSAQVMGVQSESTLSGILNIIFGDCEARGEPHVVYWLYTGPGEYVRIHPSTPVPLNYQGKQVAVTGVFSALSSGEGIMNATAVTLLDTTPVSPVVSGTRRIAMLLLRYSDSTGTTPSPSTYYSTLMNPTTNSVNAFYREESYLLLSIQADVFGWYNLPQPRSYYVAGDIYSCGTVNLNRIVNDGVVVADPYVYFPTYDDVSFVMNDYLDCCAWGGGCTITADGQTKNYGATWEPPWAQNVGVYAHEIGHSLGCPHTGFVGGNTYDSIWDVESGGSSFNGVWRSSYYSPAKGGNKDLYSYDPCHHIAYHKIRMGWIDKWHLETGTWTTTVTVNALAGTRTGFMGIKVYVRGENPTKKYFTVEARTKIYYDQWLPAEGIIIHFVDEDRTVPGVAGSENVPAYPIDANPGTTTLNDAQWSVGTTYTNAGYGLSISVLSKSGNSYQVRITGGWVSPTGSTDSAPAIAFFNNRLYAAVKGNGNTRIYLNSMNPSTLVWSGWSLLPAPSGATPSAPALAASSTYLYLVVRGMDNRIYWRRMTTGGTWSSWTPVPTGSTDAAPAATIFTFNGRLYAAVKGNGNTRIYLNSMDTGSLAWSGWVLQPGSTPNSPALTSSSSYVYMAARGGDNRIYWRRMTTGGTWSSWTAIPTGSTDSAPAIAFFNNRLFAAVNGMGSNDIYISSMDSSLLSWPSWAKLSGASPSPHALAGSPTRIYISVRGTNNIIYYQ